MKRYIISILLLAATLSGFAQQSKLSSGVRQTLRFAASGIAQDSKQTQQNFIKRNNLKAPLTDWTAIPGTAQAQRKKSADASFAEPINVGGFQVMQVWVKLTDNNFQALSNVPGVKVTSEFDKLAVANVPLDKLETIAALPNVEKVSAATRLQQRTYYARQATNVDDVLSLSNDARNAGLLQAYDGSGVVLGIIDTGIQFSHQMFKDANGNTRIKKAIVYDTTAGELKEYMGSAIDALTYDINTTNHGTHTSSIAGGSDFTMNTYYYDNSTGQTVNGSRTYGGMAPGADLVLCGLAGQLTNANIAACIQKICEYADQVGKPCVISISLGSLIGPHDGTGYLADVFEQYINGPGKVLVMAAGNSGEDNVYIGGSASRTNPLQTIIDVSDAYNGYSSGNNTLYNYFLYGQSEFYARTPNEDLAAKLYVIDQTTNEIVWTSAEISGDAIYSVNADDADDSDIIYDADLANYFFAATSTGGKIGIFFDVEEATGKASIFTNVFYLRAEDYTLNGNDVTGKYKIGISVYPKDAGKTFYIDAWGDDTFFEGITATQGSTTYTFTEGSADCSIDDDATSPYCIPVGNYTTMLGFYSTASTSSTDIYGFDGTINDISSSSSYQAPGAGPLGNKLPWITAPGEIIIAAFNTGYVNNGNTGSSSLIWGYDSANPLGAASGTSMATPCVGGIVALWLQVDPTLTLEQVKELMANTAITDDYTNGSNANRFGNGKIDALAGIKALLPDTPIIGATPQNIKLSGSINTNLTQTITVRGDNLTGNITAKLTDRNNVFKLSATSITATNAQRTAGQTLTLTFNASTVGTYNGTITLSSAGAEDVVIDITATAYNKKTIYQWTSTLTAGDEYIIVNGYTAGDNRYALGRSGTSVAADNVTIKAADDISDVVYIESDQVDATSVWTVAGTSTYTFKNGNYYIRYYYGLSFSTTASTGTSWAWNSTDNRLYYSSGWSNYYIYYNNGRYSSGWTAANSTNSVYLYKKVEVNIGEAPSIEADTLMLNFPTAGSQTVIVLGENLNEDITLSISGEGASAFSTDISTIEQDGGDALDEITVTFDPSNSGTYHATLTLSSRGAADVNINLYGEAPEPQLIVDPESLSLIGSLDNPLSGTVSILGEVLKSDVSVSITDDADSKFSLGTSSISKNAAQAGYELNVSVDTSEKGTFTANLLIQTEGVDDIIVPLTASISAAYIDVTVGSYGLATLYTDIPLSIPYRTNDDLLGVYYAKGVADGEVSMALLRNTIPANTAVIIQANSGTVRFPLYTEGTLAPLTDNILQGSTEDLLVSDIVAPGEKVMTLGMGNEGYIGFYWFVGQIIPAGRAYLLYSESSGVKGLNISFLGGGNGNITGINDAMNDVDSNAVWYTLKGVRMTGKPQRGGIYIRDGKKVMIR